MITTMTRKINRKPPTPATLAITNLVSDDKPSMVFNNHRRKGQVRDTSKNK